LLVFLALTGIWFSLEAAAMAAAPDAATGAATSQPETGASPEAAQDIVSGESAAANVTVSLIIGAILIVTIILTSTLLRWRASR